MRNKIKNEFDWHNVISDEMQSFGPIFVTPEMAAYWLTLTIGNRTISPRRTARYAIARKAGAWRMTGESIRFNVDGKMIDAHHRMSSIVESEVGCFMFVVVGVPADATPAVDTDGKYRSNVDVLKMSYDIIATARQMSASRVLLQDVNSYRSMSDQRIQIEFYLRHMKMLDWANEVYPPTDTGLGKSPVLAAVTAAAYYVHAHGKTAKKLLVNMCDVLRTGNASGNPNDVDILKFRSWLLDPNKFFTVMPEALRSRWREQSELYKIALNCFYKYLTGQKMGKIVAIKTNPFPVPGVSDGDVE